MTGRILRSVLLAIALFSLAGDGYVLAARCTPIEKGRCNACKNCRYCGHCAKQGGKCTVCAD
jgi:hypothetical protein